MEGGGGEVFELSYLHHPVHRDVSERRCGGREGEGERWRGGGGERVKGGEGDGEERKERKREREGEEERKQEGEMGEGRKMVKKREERVSGSQKKG